MEDLQLQQIHNLKASAYSFTTPAGTFNDRFVLRFSNTMLSNNEVVTEENVVKVYPNNGLYVSSSNLKIRQITVYDALGRLISEKKNLDVLGVSLEDLKAGPQVLLVKVLLQNGTTKVKKVLY